MSLAPEQKTLELDDDGVPSEEHVLNRFKAKVAEYRELREQWERGDSISDEDRGMMKDWVKDRIAMRALLTIYGLEDEELDVIEYDDPRGE